MKKTFLYAAFFGIALLNSCSSLQKEIDLDLDDYNNQPMVECYLIPGQPYNLLLSDATSYFEPFDTGIAFITGQLLQGAVVQISHNGITHELTDGLGFFPETGKIYNYGSPEIVPADYGSPFNLLITLKDGRTISAETKIIAPVTIDSVIFTFVQGDTLARAVTYFLDPNPTATNYFRYQEHLNGLDSTTQAFLTDDDFLETENIAFGAPPSFVVGDTAYHTVWHFDKPYYDFKRSLDGAVQNSTNPFGQPGGLISNVSGTANPIGIFAGLTYMRDTSIVVK